MAHPCGPDFSFYSINDEKNCYSPLDSTVFYHRLPLPPAPFSIFSGYRNISLRPFSRGVREGGALWLCEAKVKVNFI